MVNFLLTIWNLSFLRIWVKNSPINSRAGPTTPQSDPSANVPRPGPIGIRRTSAIRPLRKLHRRNLPRGVCHVRSAQTFGVRKIAHNHSLAGNRSQARGKPLLAARCDSAGVLSEPSNSNRQETAPAPDHNNLERCRSDLLCHFR